MIKEAYQRIKSTLPDGVTIASPTTTPIHRVELYAPREPVLDVEGLMRIDTSKPSVRHIPMEVYRVILDLGIVKNHRRELTPTELLHAYEELTTYINRLNMYVSDSDELNRLVLGLSEDLGNYYFGNNIDFSGHIDAIITWRSTGKHVMNFQNEVIHDSPQQHTVPVNIRNCRMVHIYDVEYYRGVDKLLIALNTAFYHNKVKEELLRTIKSKRALITTYTREMNAYERDVSYYNNWDTDIQYDTTEEMEEHTGKLSPSNFIAQGHKLREYSKLLDDKLDEVTKEVDTYDRDREKLNRSFNSLETVIQNLLSRVDEIHEPLEIDDEKDDYY